MSLLPKIALLVVLTRILSVTKKPFLCSGIYTGIIVLFSILYSLPILGTLLVAAIVMATSSLYFWLLNRFSDNLPAYWTILIVGLAIGLV